MKSLPHFKPKSPSSFNTERILLRRASLPRRCAPCPSSLRLCRPPCAPSLRSLSVIAASTPSLLAARRFSRRASPLSDR
ncbi:MFS transporter [Sesbania bispinosa]|nr:MFS transporter [Sesbania bispinosa]